jgi:hypothetical protein
MEQPLACDLASLATRVSTLERRNRQLWALVIGVAALTAASLTAGVTAAPKALGVVEASQFLLKASETEVRGELRIHPTEGGKLYLYGSDGHQTQELPLRQQTVPLSSGGAAQQPVGADGASRRRPQ